MNRAGIEMIAWIAGIIGTVVALVGLVFAFMQAEDTSPSQSVRQKAGNMSTQIGIARGNVDIRGPEEKKNAEKQDK